MAHFSHQIMFSRKGTCLAPKYTFVSELWILGLSRQRYMSTFFETKKKAWKCRISGTKSHIFFDIGAIMAQSPTFFVKVAYFCNQIQHFAENGAFLAPNHVFFSRKGTCLAPKYTFVAKNTHFWLLNYESSPQPATLYVYVFRRKKKSMFLARNHTFFRKKPHFSHQLPHFL